MPILLNPASNAGQAAEKSNKVLVVAGAAGKPARTKLIGGGWKIEKHAAATPLQ